MKIQSIQSYNQTSNQKRLKTDNFSSKSTNTIDSKCSFKGVYDGKGGEIIFANHWERQKF